MKTSSEKLWEHIRKELKRKGDPDKQFETLSPVMIKVNRRIKGGKIQGDLKWKEKGFTLRFFRLKKNGDLVETREYDKVDPTEIILTV